MIDNTALLSELYSIQESYSVIEADIDQTSKRCVIDVKERTISVPKEIESLGVQYDHRSYRLFFEIDRYIHGVDLLTQTCVIQWLSKNGTAERSGLHPIVEIEAIDNDKLLFVWELYEDETRIPGVILFAVNFYTMKDENSFLWSYNTLPAQSIIQDTLDVVINPSDEITPSLLMVWNDKMTSIEKLARDSVSTSSRSAHEAEAWAHGRTDFPNTMLDNAKYYKDLTQALYDEAKDALSEEKDRVVEEAKDEIVNLAKDEVIAVVKNEVTDDVINDVYAAKNDSIAAINDTTTSAIQEVEQSKNNAINDLFATGDQRYAVKGSIPTKVSELENDRNYLTEVPDAPVKSVNGKTGDVDLSAEDVGAVTYEEFTEFKVDYDNHTHTAADVGAATSEEVTQLKSDLTELEERVDGLSGGSGGSGATEEQLTQIEQNKNDIADLRSNLNEFTVEGEVPINICNEIYEYGRFGSDGVDIEAGYVGAFRTVAYLKVVGGKTIKAVMGQNATFSATAPIQLVQYNADKEIIVPRVDFFATKSNGNITSSSKTPQELTLNDETVYIRFDVCNWGNVGALEDVQVGLYYVDDEVEDYLPHSITKTETFLNPEKIKGLNTLNATGVKTFPDVEAMKNSLDVVVGDVCETLGYYTSGDGGGTAYTIVSGLDTAKYQILLANGLYASLIHDESINVKCLGAVCDASTDNHDVFQKAFDIATKAVIIPSGTYQLKTPVNVSGKSNFSIYAQDSNIRYWGSEDYAFRFTNINQCDLYFGNISCFNGGSGIEIYSENGDNPVQYVNVNFRSVSSDTNAFYLHASEDVTHGQVTEVRFHKGRVLGYNGIKGVGFKIVNEGGAIVDHFTFEYVGIEGVDTGFHFEGLLDDHPTGNPTFGYCRMIEITNCRMCESFNTLIKTVGHVSNIKIDSSVYLKPSFFDFGNLTDYCYINGAICDEGYGQTGWKAYVQNGIIVPVNEAEERYEDNVSIDLNNLNVFTLPSRMIIPDTLETLKLSIQYGLRDYGINEFELIFNGVNSNFKVLDHEGNVVFNNVSNLNEGDVLRFKWRYISGWTVEKLNTIALTT